MALYIQHGHGKGDRISQALTAGSADGVILSPRNEKPENVAACLSQFREADDNAVLLLDPQFFVGAIVPPKEGRLTDYHYYPGGLSLRSFTTRQTQKWVAAALDYQDSLDLDKLVAPTVVSESLSDRWHQIALNLADAALDHHRGMDTGKPILLNFTFEESALDDQSAVEQFLDHVTQDGWDQEGFTSPSVVRNGDTTNASGRQDLVSSCI